MDRDTELLKVQAYADYAHSRFTVETSYLLGAMAALVFTLFGLRLQDIIPMEVYGLSILVGVLIIGFWLRNDYKNYTRRMARVDGLIKKVNIMQSIPTIEEMISGKAWKKDKKKKY